MRINVHAQGFRGQRATVNGAHSLKATRVDVFRALVTVGRPGRRRSLSTGFGPASLAAPGLSLAEVAYLAFMVIAYMENSYAGVRMNARFRELDGSEKQGVSYRVGMALAALFAERLLGIPGLEHADHLLRTGALVLHQGGRRGDLVGWDTGGDWHVFEAKGRSSSSGVGSALVGAKQQAENLRLIDGTTGAAVQPATACGCVSDLSTDPISVYARDPEGDPVEPSVYALDTAGAIRGHYDLVRGLAATQDALTPSVLPEAPDVVIRSTEIEDTGVEIGVHEAVYEALNDPARDWASFGPAFAREWEPRWRGLIALPGRTLSSDSESSIGLDGYFFRLKSTSSVS